MDMAERLNCSRQLYQGTRSGKIPPGNKILKGISIAFPDLQEDVIYFLSNDANRLPEGANRNPLKTSSEPRGRGIRKFCVGLIGRIRKGGKG